MRGRALGAVAAAAGVGVAGAQIPRTLFMTIPNASAASARFEAECRRFEAANPAWTL